MTKFEVTQKIKHKRIFCRDIVLVPYENYLVPNYHEWMQSDELCEQTDSIKLSLEEEHKAQNSWMNDPTKLTFIICDSDSYHKTGYRSQEERECQSMIGDINLYFNENGDNDIEEPFAELSLMIADNRFRRKGYANQAVKSMLTYVHNTFPTLSCIVAIISDNNEASLKLFQEKLNFKMLKFIRPFKQFKLLFKFNHDFEAEFQQNKYVVEDV